MDSNNYLARGVKYLKPTMIFLAVIFALFSHQSASAQYCEPYYMYGGPQYNMWFDNVKFGTTIDNWTGWGYGSYNDFTYMSVSANLGGTLTYEVSVVDYYWYSGYYIWIDLNQNGSFDDEGEQVYNSGQLGSNSYYTESGQFTIPETALTGTTRMRIMCFYWGYSYDVSSCYMAYDGDTQDYTIEIMPPPPDAAITSITGPAEPIVEGNYPVTCTLASKADVPVEYAMINWSIDDVYQGSTEYYGYLQKNESTEISLGDVAFFYPQDEYYFKPFQLRVWVSNVNYFKEDKDTKNDLMLLAIKAITEDAGISSVNVPTTAFDPATPQKITATIMNYAPKPLRSVIVHWSIDDVNQPVKTITGKNILKGETLTIDLSTTAFPLKTPLDVFTIKAWTTFPNDNDDQVIINDGASATTAAALVPGTYKIAGMGNNFPTMGAAANYMNTYGVVKDGQLEFVLDPGYYNDPVIFNDFSHSNNTFVIRSRSGNPVDVTLSFAPKSGSAVVDITNIPNVTIKDLTISVQSGNSGRALWAKNSNNFLATNCNIYGLKDASGNEEYSLLSFYECQNVKVLKNKTFYGSDAIFYSYTGSETAVNLEVKDNSFSDFGTGGVNFSTSSPNSGDNVLITNNKFQNMSSVTATYGIKTFNGSTITDNILQGFAGNGSGDGVINLTNTSTEKYSMVQNNTISSATNINGIMTNGTMVKIYHNSVEADDSEGAGTAAINLNNSTGYFGNNMIQGTASGVNLINSYEVYMAYNTVVNKSTSNANFMINGGNAYVMRNLMINRGGGPVSSVIGASVVSNENNIYSSSDLEGAELSQWISSVSDNGSVSTNVTFESEKDLRIGLYNSNLLLMSPLSLPDDLNTEVQNYDWEKSSRGEYSYIGADNILLEISLDTEPQSIVNCIGATQQMLFVAATMNYGTKPTFQWEKDGVPIPGATDSKLNIDTIQYSKTGVYRCKVSGPANTEAGIYTREVVLYALYPTAITKEPENILTDNHANATFVVEAHLKGIVPPFYQHQYQWYRQKGNKTTTLLNDARYSGTKSTTFSIRDVQPTDLNDETDVTDYYFVVVTGLCGVDTSRAVNLRQGGGINILQSPADATVCQGQELMLAASAQMTGNGESISYHWMVNSNDIIDNVDISGSKTEVLTIKKADIWMAGKYTCEVTVQPGNIRKLTTPASIDITELPGITSQSPSNISIEEKQNTTLFVNGKGGDVLSYQWSKDGANISGATNADLVLSNAVIDNSGKYACKITNKCGEFTCAEINLVVTPGNVSSIGENGNSSTFELAPNPVNETAEVKFASNGTRAKLTLMDATGREVAVIFEGTAVIGTNTLRIDSGAMNLSSGVYFLRLESNGASEFKSMVVVR